VAGERVSPGRPFLLAFGLVLRGDQDGDALADCVLFSPTELLREPLVDLEEDTLQWLRHQHKFLKLAGGGVYERVSSASIFIYIR
jgi:hypothetical protein